MLPNACAQIKASALVVLHGQPGHIHSSSDNMHAIRQKSSELEGNNFQISVVTHVIIVIWTYSRTSEAFPNFLNAIVANPFVSKFFSTLAIILKSVNRENWKEIKALVLRSLDWPERQRVKMISCD